MPTVADLGRSVKAKHPEYADIPDEVLGLKVQARFPGSYDDFSPAGMTMPQPAGLQGPPPGVLLQALQNLPGSALGLLRSSFPPTALYDLTKAGIAAPQDVLPNAVSGAVGPFIHPEDSFAQDPLGTALAWYGGAEGLRRGAPLAKTGAGGAIEGIKAEMPDIRRWAKYGGTAGAVLGHGGLENILEGGGVGGAVGGGIRAIPAAVRGAADALSKRSADLAAAKRVGAPTSPIWGNPSVSPVNLSPVLDPTVAPQPRPMTAPAAPLQRTPTSPIWGNLPAPPADLAPTDIGPIPQPTLTPRAPGGPQLGPRIPVWQQAPPNAPPAAVPNANPIAGPPGRPISLAPVQPSAPPSAGPISMPPPPAPLTGLHLPEVPAHYAGEPNPTAAFKVDQNVAQYLRRQPNFDPATMTVDDVNAARKALGHRLLKGDSVDRRLGHLRAILAP